MLLVSNNSRSNSKHHDTQATPNHVRTVPSIRQNQQKPEKSTSFVAFDTCSNYGGHLAMSVSGTSCSSEATGRGSGIAGLLYSMAVEKKLTPPITAEEAIQLFKMTADDIDIESSRKVSEDAKWYWSQPGYDQRFGYGRANAMRIVEAIDKGLIPPEVDIVAPHWFASVYADRSNGPIAITGRVAAARAKSYDYKVQWAPGVQPEEKDYKDLSAPLTNVPGLTVSGGNVPLAQIDPLQIDTTHIPDPDSKLGENARSISIRIHAVAHYDNGDVHGEARRVIAITNEKNQLDKDLLPGFPIYLGTSIEGSAKLADIDGDGVRDIVQPDTSGRLHVFTMKSGLPVEVPGFPYTTRVIDGLNKDLTSEPTVPSYLAGTAYKTGASGGVDPLLARETLMQAPAV